MTEPDRLAVRGWNRKRRPADPKPLVKAEHGTRSGYVYGCGCEDCTRAERLYSRAYKRKRAAAEREMA